MRPRFVMLCSALSAVALPAAPGLAAAAPHHNRGLTINATPNPILSGEGVLIYGQLKGTGDAGKTVVLYHHISDRGHPGYQIIGQTTTDSFGFYKFTREEGVVRTNRSWFTRLAGDPTVHSRTVYERVEALVSLTSGTSGSGTVNGVTNHPLTFAGHVDPNHAGERVYLQARSLGSDDWHALASGRLGAGSNYSITIHPRVAGTREVRAVFRGDDQNVRGVSDPLTVTIQQAQNPAFTINSATPVISYGSPATITGTLLSSTATPAPSTAVTLCDRLADQSQFTCSQATTTGTDGSYSFTVSPTHNAVYYVRTVLPPARRTSALFIGVKDLITLSASSAGTVGQSDTFSGTVTPDKSGKLVYLQRLGSDGDYHTVQVTQVQANGSYSISRVFGTAGSKTFRTRILGGEFNLGAASTPVTVTVALPTSTASLPPAS